MAINLSVEYPLLEAKVQRLQNENENIKKLLHDLTPGGSEFYNDAEYCAKWIKENRQNSEQALKEVIKELRGKNGELMGKNKQLLEALTDIIGSHSQNNKVEFFLFGELGKKAKSAIQNNQL